MKTILIFGAIIAIILVLFQTYIVMSTNKTKEQPFTVIEQEDEFEVRFYPSAYLATIHSQAKTYKELASPGFRALAGYIFGGNQESKSIAMTAPVYMNINDSASSMSFVMPSNYDTTNLPKPNDSRVVLSKSKEQFVAIYKFSGFANNERIKEFSSKLAALLSKKQLTATGPYAYLGYNPPYQLISRRNEISVPINWNKK